MADINETVRIRGIFILWMARGERYKFHLHSDSEYTFLRNSSINLMAKEATDEIKIIYQSVTRKDNVHRYSDFLLLFFHVANILTGTTITYQHFGCD